MKRVAVYCGSATPAEPLYLEDARAVEVMMILKGMFF